MDSLTLETQKKMGFNITVRLNREPVILMSLVITAIPALENKIDRKFKKLYSRKIVWSAKYTDGPTSIELQMLAYERCHHT